VGFPDSASFDAAYRELAGFHDELWQRTGILPGSTVLGGFSMGSVMSYSLGLGPGRPSPAGILAFSGFVPSVEGWHADLDGREGLRVFIAHGRRDPVIDVEFARSARDLLRGAGLEVSYHESDVGHSIDPAHVPLARNWLQSMFAPDPSG
jgi:phospholipase/carboxylesterase